MADPKNITDPNLLKLLPSVADAEENARKLYSDTMRAQIAALKVRRGDAAQNDILNWQPMVDGDVNPAKVSDTALRNAVEANPFQQIPHEALAKLIAETRAEIARCGPGSEEAVEAIRRAIEKGVPHDAFLEEAASETPNGVRSEPASSDTVETRSANEVSAPHDLSPLANEAELPAEPPKRMQSANTIVAAALNHAMEAVRKEAVLDSPSPPRPTSAETRPNREIAQPAHSNSRAVMWAASLFGVAVIGVVAWLFVRAPAADTLAKPRSAGATSSSQTVESSPVQARTGAVPGTATAPIESHTGDVQKPATSPVPTMSAAPAVSVHPVTPLSASTGAAGNPGSVFKGED